MATLNRSWITPMRSLNEEDNPGVQGQCDRCVLVVLRDSMPYGRPFAAGNPYSQECLVVNLIINAFIFGERSQFVIRVLHARLF